MASNFSGAPEDPHYEWIWNAATQKMVRVPKAQTTAHSVDPSSSNIVRVKADDAIFFISTIAI